MVRPVRDVAPEARELIPTRLPWQDVAWHLLSADGWSSEWGDKPSRPPTTIVIVAANQIGKSTLLGQGIAGHATGRLKRFLQPGELWGGMPTLADSVAVQRMHVARWLGTDDSPRWTPKEGRTAAQSYLTTRQGWAVRLKAYEQEGSRAGSQAMTAFESGTCQAVYLDEPPPDDVVNACRARLTRHHGPLVVIFTALQGAGGALYEQCWGPWQEYRRQHPDARWGEVAPGTWVFALGKGENAVSRGGWLPDEAIAQERMLLEAQGRHLEARVRFDGEWLDISADRLIPAEMLRQWSQEPKGGWRATVAWIDPAYTARESSCETAIAVASMGHAGDIYLRESISGRWQAHEKIPRCADVLIRHGCPLTGVQRVTGDMQFAESLNGELMRRSARACVVPWPKEGEGRVPDKIARFQAFAPMVAAGQVHVLPEHVEMRRQAGLASVDYIKGGGLVDCLDAAVGACMLVVETSGQPGLSPQAIFTSARDDSWQSWGGERTIGDGDAWRGDLYSESL